MIGNILRVQSVEVFQVVGMFDSVEGFIMK